MSAAHAHSASHDRGGLKPYIIGFVLAAVLTAAPFWAVMKGVVSGAATVALVMGLAAVQILVHLTFFLHIDRRTDRWTALALMFTLFVLAVVIGGSLWVMYHLNHNMMMPTPLEG